MRIVYTFVTASMLAAALPHIAHADAPEVYVPGLGEFMGAIQMRHAKLWFAGRAKNWDLAAYELNELKEAFADAAKYQPNFKGKPIAELIGQATGEPLASLAKAIAAKDAPKFAEAMDRLSAACASCHQSTGYGFIQNAPATSRGPRILTSAILPA